MKNLILTLAICSAGIIQAQVATPSSKDAGCDHKTVNFHQEGNLFRFHIVENERGQFEKDPISFIKDSFDVKKAIKDINDPQYESFDASFSSRKGIVKVNFDETGEIVGANSLFKNTILPLEVSRLLLKEHKGWEVVKNSHYYEEKNGSSVQDMYRLVLIKEGKRKIVKISRDNLNNSQLVYN